VGGYTNITASSVYNYFFYVAENSYTQDLGSGLSAFPYEIEWNANRVATYGNGLVVVFDPSVSSAKNAVLIVTWHGIRDAQGEFNVVQTSCSNSQYSTCNSTSFTGCYPYVSYYDITICPCDSCTKMVQFQAEYPDAYETGTYTSVQTTEFAIGNVDFPLTLSMTTVSPTQGVYAAVIESAVLNFSG